MDRTLSGPRAATLLGDFPTSPAYQGLAQGLGGLIADGRIPVGTRLPSERDLTAALGVSRTTVTRAYQLLGEVGYASARRGSGTVAALPVARGHRGDHLLTPAEGGGDDFDLTCAATVAPAGTSAAYEGGRGRACRPTSVATATSPRVSRRCGRPSPPAPRPRAADLPVADHRDGRCSRRPGHRGTGDDRDGGKPGPDGEPDLPERHRHPAARGVPDRRGRRRRARLGHRLRSPPPCGQSRPARAVFLIPDFQHPTGAPAALRATSGTRCCPAHLPYCGAHRRGDLVDLPLEGQDDARPLRLPSSPTAITLGSASKSFWGGLRIGWLRVPDSRFRRGHRGAALAGPRCAGPGASSSCCSCSPRRARSCPGDEPRQAGRPQTPSWRRCRTSCRPGPCRRPAAGSRSGPSSPNPCPRP